MSTERPETPHSRKPPSGGSGEIPAPEGGSAADAGDPGQQPVGEKPDLLLNTPVLNVEEIELAGEELQARVSLSAELADFVKINAGITTHLEQAKINAKGIEAQTLVEIRLDRVLDTLDRALNVIDRNPQVLNSPADETPKASHEEQWPATGAARRLAEQSGVDLAAVTGTGSGGRITVKDVRRAAKDEG